MSLFPFFLQISCLFSFHEAERHSGFKFDWNLSLGVPIQAVKGTHEKTVRMNVERYHTSCTYDLPTSLFGDETKLVHFLTYPKVLFGTLCHCLIFKCKRTSFKGIFKARISIM